MGLILREEKCSKLTSTEMDDNLKYLESINSGSSGSSGTSCIDGISGSSGTSGIDGTSGSSGSSGVSVIISGTDNFLTKISGITITESNIYIDGVDVLKISTHKGEFSDGKNIFIGGGDLSIGEDGNTTRGSRNTFFGYYAGSGNTIGMMNTFAGNFAGRDNTEGYYNTFLGNFSGLKNINGNDNTFIGNQAGFFNEGGYFNTNIGSYAGYSDLLGLENTYIGFAAGYENRNGNYNVFIGSNAGRLSNVSNNTLSNESIFIGYNTKSLVSGSTNEVIIGSWAIGNGSNTITYGNNSITNHVFTSGNLKINSIDISGFTQIGSDAPKIKMLKLTGTTESTEGGVATVDHGLNGDKIISITAKVIYDTNKGMMPETSFYEGYQYSLNQTDTKIYIANHTTNSENILNKPFVVTIMYEE